MKLATRDLGIRGVLAIAARVSLLMRPWRLLPPAAKGAFP